MAVERQWADKTDGVDPVGADIFNLAFENIYDNIDELFDTTTIVQGGAEEMDEYYYLDNPILYNINSGDNRYYLFVIGGLFGIGTQVMRTYQYRMISGNIQVRQCEQTDGVTWGDWTSWKNIGSTNDFTNALKAKLEGLENYDDSEIRSVIYSDSEVVYTDEVSITVKSGYYTADGRFWESSSFSNATIENVSIGEKYKLTSYTTTGAGFPCVIFYDSEDEISGYGFIGSEMTPSDAPKDKFFTIGEGGQYIHAGTNIQDTTKMIIQCIVGPEFKLYKGTPSPSFYNKEQCDSKFEPKHGRIAYEYNAENHKITIGSKYNNTKDFVMEFAKRGPNNIYDFKNDDLKDNNTEYPLISNVSNFVPSYQNNVYGMGGSDWHSPIIVRAINNIDGDNKNPDGTYKEHFTGGNHNYNNQGISGAGLATGRSSDIIVYADGHKITQTSTGFCNTLSLTWTDYVQALNTTKINGTGREVIIENHMVEYDGKEWKEQVDLIPLEDVQISNFYGFSRTETPNNIRFLGSDDRGTYGQNTKYVYGKKCYSILSYSDIAALKINLDLIYGMGNGQHLRETNPYNAQTIEATGKSYTVVISDGAEYKKLNIYSVIGGWTFFPTEELGAKIYGIKKTLTNCTITDDVGIMLNGTATLTLVANAGHTLPTSITVNHATLNSYNSTTGKISISNPTDGVEIIAVAT